MKTLFFALCLMATVGAHAGEGIQFSHISWKEAKEKAIKEKKLIFIDFYTQWCGPCLLMQKEVFVLNDVAGFFNTTFINLKVDAENGEGIELARKYKVHVYPTYTFIDPATENLVHESSGRQEKSVFLQTAKNASDPKNNSNYLIAQYKGGNTNPDFLINYANYEASRYNREEVTKIAEKLAVTPGYSLENEKVWALFVNNVNGRESLLFKDLVANTKKYTALYGKEAVDKKLYNAYQYSPDPSVIAGAPDFKGKDYLIKKNDADRFIKAEKYQEAGAILDEMMVNPGDYKAEICNHVYFIARSNLGPKSHYGNKAVPDFWKKKCVSFMQYAAYNSPERDNAQLHYFYAVILEELLKSVPEAAKLLPDDFSSPSNGTKEYSIRSQELKQKPVKNKS